MQTTVETYLPPITSKVTNFTTITQYMTYLQSLAASSNMSYVKSTLDVGAAINSCKFLWSSFTCFENLVIHLGGFHFRKENFQVSIFSTRAIWNNMFDYIVSSTEYRNSFYHFPSRGITCKTSKQDVAQMDHLFDVRLINSYEVVQVFYEILYFTYFFLKYLIRRKFGADLIWRRAKMKFLARI